MGPFEIDFFKAGDRRPEEEKINDDAVFQNLKTAIRFFFDSLIFYLPPCLKHTQTTESFEHPLNTPGFMRAALIIISIAFAFQISYISPTMAQDSRSPSGQQRRSRSQDQNITSPKTVPRAGTSKTAPAKSTPKPTAKPATTPKPTRSAVAKSAIAEAVSGEISKELHEIKSCRKVGTTDIVEIALEVVGKTNQISPEGKETTENMKVFAGFRYEERVLDFKLEEPFSLRSVRDYSLAKAIMNIGGNQLEPVLDSNNRLVVCEIDKKGTILFSPQGPLKSEHLLLIEGIQANTLSLELMLPEKNVRIGDSWKIPTDALLSFMCVDGIAEQSMEATLTSVVDDLAMIEIVGDLQGSFLGAYTEMSLHAKIQYDLKTQRINWVGMLLDENRSIGHVGPGLDVKARLQVKISALEKPNALTDDLIGDLDLVSSDRQLRLRYDNGKAPWNFQFPRNWYIILDEENKTLMRLLDKGELIAQCNIVAMPKIDPKKPTTLKSFCDDLLKGLTKNNANIVLSEESRNSASYTELRVILDGKVEDDLPLRWVYYLLTDEKGNQTVVVFVIEAELLQRFGDADERILETFRMK